MLLSWRSTISAARLVSWSRVSIDSRTLTDRAGVAADLSHINANSTVNGYQPEGTGLSDALAGSEIVLIPAGVPRKPGMTRDGKFGQTWILILAEL